MQAGARPGGEWSTQNKFWPKMDASRFSTIAQISGIDIKDQ